MIYAGIGNRQIPLEHLAILKEIGKQKASDGWTLRSGGAKGSDTSFENGCDEVDGLKEIYTPKDNIPNWAFSLIHDYHPAPHNLRGYAKRLMARNGMILLGKDGKTPCDEVVCYAINEKKGGTAYGINIAKAYNIPVRNIYKEI